VADVVGLIGAPEHVHPKAHQASLIADMVIDMQIGQHRNATLRDSPTGFLREIGVWASGLPQGERKLHFETARKHRASSVRAELGRA
jgi:hypothetical protein